MRPRAVIETEDDVMLVFKCYGGSQMADVMDMVDEAHPDLFTGCEERAAIPDAEVNLYTLDSCPCCGGTYVQVIGGPKCGEVRISERRSPPQPTPACTALPAPHSCSSRSR